MLHDRRSPKLSNAHPRARLASADPVRNGQHEWAAQSAPLVLIASSVSSVRRAWREGAQAFAAVEVADHGQLLCCLTPRPPAILLLDLDLPQLGGMEGVSGLRALQPATSSDSGRPPSAAAWSATQRSAAWPSSAAAGKRCSGACL